MSALPPLGAGAPVFVFDVGGTDIKSALCDSHGVLQQVRRSSTPVSEHAPAETVIAHLARIRAEYLASHPDYAKSTVGLSVPGLVDERAGLGIFSSNIGWRNAPIRALAETAFGVPVAFGHDVRAAALAEYRLGSARDFGDVVIITIGTGIAGTIILGGVPYSGGGYAGEFGHSLAQCVDGELCSCGAVGCLETIASASAIAKRYSRASGVHVHGALEVLEAARSGDQVARKVWDTAVTALAQQLARVVSTLAPEAIVIGGGLARAGEALFEPLRREVDALLSFHRRPALIAAALGGDAGLIGTALVARDLEHRQVAGAV